MIIEAILSLYALKRLCPRKDILKGWKGMSGSSRGLIMLVISREKYVYVALNEIRCGLLFYLSSLLVLLVTFVFVGV
jgi:hypothetical protein